MDIRNESDAHYTQPRMADVGGGMKRARDDAVLDDAEKRQRREAGPQDRAMLQTTLVDRLVSMGLSALPADMLSIIAGSLSLTEFAHLATVCKALSTTKWAPSLGREKITEMGCVLCGKDILLAIQGDTPMRSDWQSRLYFLFSRKVQSIELHDHAVLQKAWQARLDVLEADTQVMFDPEAENDLDALRWFMMSPSKRDTLCRKGRVIDDCVVNASDSEALKRFPGPSLLRILERLRLLYRDSRVYQQMLAEVGTDLQSNVQAGCSVSRDIAIDMAIEFCQEPFFHNVSQVLCRDLRVSEAEVRRNIDPIVAEIVHGFTYDNDTSLDYECNRWRAGDETFRRLVEDAYLRTIALRRFRNDEFSRLVNHYESDALKASMDARIMQRYTQFETLDGAIFSGDAALEENVTGLLLQISQCTFDTFPNLCDASQKMPHRVAPLLMQRLASKVPRLSGNGSDTSAIALDKLALFDAFLAWRDRVLPSLNASGDSRLVERAYAAPLSLWAKLPQSENNVHTRDRIKEAALEGFAALPPAHWAEILENLMSLDAHFIVVILGAERVASVMQQLIRDPRTKLVHPSVGLVTKVVEHAIPIWDTLPDRSLSGTSRIDAFSDRFCLSFHQRQNLAAKLLRSIADRFRDRNDITLIDGLQAYGFAGDSRAHAVVENHIWHDALAYPRYVFAQFSNNLSKVALQSVSLRNRVTLYRAGTTHQLMRSVPVSGAPH